jgi:hypothetical protein
MYLFFMVRKCLLGVFFGDFSASGKLASKPNCICFALDLVKERSATEERKPVAEVWVLNYSDHFYPFTFTRRKRFTPKSLRV